MNRRHVRAAIAVLALIAVPLAGCASSPSTGAETAQIDGTGKTLSVLVPAIASFPGEQQAWFDDVSDQFAELTGATVTFETFATPSDELTKIQTSVLSGQGPDVYSLGTTFTPVAYSTGAFVELTDELWEKVGGRDRFVPATLGLSGPDEDSEVGVPFASRPFVLAYNTRLFAAAGLDAPATTWDGLTEQAKALTSGDVHGLAVAYADSFDPWKFVWAMSLQAGNPILDLDEKKVTIDDPSTERAYERYFGWLAEDEVVDPAAIGWKNSQALASFAEGKAAIMPMVSPSSRATLDSSAIADEYAYAVMPTVPPGEDSLPKGGTPASSIISGDNMVVAKYSKNQDLAFALIEMLTRVENQIAYNELFGDLPTNAEAAEQVQSGDAVLEPILDSGSQAVGTPFSGAWGDTQLALVNVVVQSIPALSNGSVGDSDLSRMLAEAQASAQASLDKAK